MGNHCSSRFKFRVSRQGCSRCLAIAVLRSDFKRVKALLVIPGVTYSDRFVCSPAELEKVLRPEEADIPTEMSPETYPTSRDFDAAGKSICSHNEPLCSYSFMTTSQLGRNRLTPGLLCGGPPLGFCAFTRVYENNEIQVDNGKFHLFSLAALAIMRADEKTIAALCRTGVFNNEITYDSFVIEPTGSIRVPKFREREA